MDNKEFTEKFQCPGCTLGSDTKCGSYRTADNWNSCRAHVLGTSLGIGNYFALGLPVGFNRPGMNEGKQGERTPRFQMDIRFWSNGDKPEWDNFNVAVWAMEEDGFLFVRTYLPRRNIGFLDVIEGGTLALTPGAIDAGKFRDEMD